MGEISNGTRILLTQYLLKKLTDEDHALSRDELIERIGGLGTTISSNTVKADIESIKSYNNIIKERQNELFAPHSCNNESGYIDYATKQKKGAYVEKTYYSDAQLIILTRLLSKGLHLKRSGDTSLLEKVLSDSSLYKINHYHLFEGIDKVQEQNNIMTCLEQIIKAINTFSCVSFRQVEYGVVDNQIIDIANHKTILVYPTNVDIKNDQVYIVGYQINSAEEFELSYYRIDRISQLKITRTPKYVQAKTKCFNERIWMSNDPLGIAKKNLINLELRVYLDDENVFEVLFQRFKGCPFNVEQFRRFINISIENAPIENDLIEWFLQFGNHVEVFKPVELRNHLKDAVAQMYLMYRK